MRNTPEYESSVPEDPDSPQKKLQMANGFSKVQWFQWLDCSSFRSIGCLFRSAEFCQQNYSNIINVVIPESSS